MRNSFFAILVGLITSVTGGYLYSYLISINFPFIYVLGTIAAIASIAALIYIVRARLLLLFASGIVGYFPKGQTQYIDRLVKSISTSRNVIIAGARGMDLAGENSPAGKALMKAKKKEKVEIFLLEPGGEHSRLRSEHLEVEKKKYEAECVSVDSFFKILQVQHHIPITKYSYTAKPLFRLIITDEFAFVSIYQSGIRGRDLPCWQILNTSQVLYPKVLSYCEFLRAHSASPNNPISLEEINSGAETDA